MTDFDTDGHFEDPERLMAAWDFEAARDSVQELLEDPELSAADVITARRLLAEILRELGDLAAAYDLAEAVSRQAELRYGPRHLETVHALAVLATVRHDYDEWDAAEALYHRVLASDLDDDPEAVAVIQLARVNLALLHRDRGDRALALTMLNAAYVVHRRDFGAEDLDTIRIAAELAALHHADGNLAASRRLFTLAYSAARSRLGHRHPLTRAVEWELAAVEPPMPAALLHDAAPVGDAALAGDAGLAGDDFEDDVGPVDGDIVDEFDDLVGTVIDDDFDDRAFGGGEPAGGESDGDEPDGDEPDGDELDGDELDDDDQRWFGGPSLDGPSRSDAAPLRSGAVPPQAEDWPAEWVGAPESADPGWQQVGPGEWIPAGSTGSSGSAGLVGSEGLVGSVGSAGSVGGAPDPEPLGNSFRLVVPLRALVAVVAVALIVAGVAVVSDRAGRSDTTGGSGSLGRTVPAAGAPPGQPPGTATGRSGRDAGSDGQATGRDGSVAPLNVRLRDEGTALAVSWTALRATVVVALSRAGAPAVVLASVPPDTTEYVVHDVEPGVQYCVVVGPISETVALTAATSVCTGAR